MPMQPLSFYWQHYELHQDPFAPGIDEAITFILSKWEHHLDLLQHLLHNENALLAIIGVPGIGITTFKNLLLNQIKDSMQVVSVNAHVGMSSPHLVQLIAQGFNLQLQPGESLEEQLDKLITQIQYHKTECVLMMDEAETLNKDVLQTLLFSIRQQSEAQKRFHVILLGKLELQTKLATLARQAISSDLIHTLELEHLSFEETRQYLQHRLAVAGLKSEVPFNEIDIEQIHQIAEGVPAEINRQAQQMMLERLQRERSRRRVPFMRKNKAKLLGGLSIVTALVGLALFLNQEELGEDHTSKPHLAFANQTREIAIPEAGTQGNVEQTRYTSNTPANTNTENASPPSFSFTDQNGDKPPVEEATQSSADPTQPNGGGGAGEEQTATTTTTTTNGIINNNGVNVKPQEAVNQQAPMDDTQDLSGIPNHRTARSIQSIAATPDAAMTNANDTPTNQNAHPEAIQQEAIQSEVSTPPPVTTHVVEAQKDTVTRVKVSSASSQSLLKVAGSHYTLQLLGASKEEAVKQFINFQHLQNKANYYRTHLYGKPWFVVIYGDYPSRVAAQKAKQMLPASLQKYNPWLRTYSSIQADIRKKS